MKKLLMPLKFPEMIAENTERHITFKNKLGSIYYK